MDDMNIVNSNASEQQSHIWWSECLENNEADAEEMDVVYEEDSQVHHSEGPRKRKHKIYEEKYVKDLVRDFFCLNVHPSPFNVQLVVVIIL